MKRIVWRDVLAWSLSAFFVLGGTLNLVAPTSIADDYARWGYPTWFHYLTGLLELLCAGLLLRFDTRRAGILLGGLVMGAALLTLIAHHEWAHAGIPALIMVALCAAWRRPGRPHGLS